MFRSVMATTWALVFINVRSVAITRNGEARWRVFIARDTRMHRSNIDPELLLALGILTTLAVLGVAAIAIWAKVTAG